MLNASAVPWFVLALATALTVGVRDVLVKHISRRLPVEMVAAGELLFGLPFFVAALFFIPVPPLDRTFWVYFLLSIPVNIASYRLYLTALHVSPISLSVPFLSFTPLFMVLTGTLVLGELPGLLGTAGIVFIACGSYLIHLDRNTTGVLAPFAAIARERGSRIMVLVAFLFSFAAVIGKKAMLHSSPLFFSFFFFAVFNVLMLGILFLSGKVRWNIVVFQGWKRGMVLGCLLAVHIAGHALAISMITAAYMIAVKRTSIFFTVLLGGLLFKEDQLAKRLMGTLLMVLGVICITLFG